MYFLLIKIAYTKYYQHFFIYKNVFDSNDLFNHKYCYTAFDIYCAKEYNPGRTCCPIYVFIFLRGWFKKKTILRNILILFFILVRCIFIVCFVTKRNILSFYLNVKKKISANYCAIKFSACIYYSYRNSAKMSRFNQTSHHFVFLNKILV